MKSIVAILIVAALCVVVYRLYLTQAMPAETKHLSKRLTWSA